MVNLAAGNLAGDAITVLWTEGAEMRVGYGMIVSEVPFAVELEGDAMPHYASDVRLVRDQGERWVAGSASVHLMDEGLLMLRAIRWEEPSARVHDRREVEWPATLRILDDRGTRETFQVGRTVDVSLGGAGLRLEDAPEVGSLVELKAMPHGERPMRAVGVVVRRNEDLIGLAFLYLWGAEHIEHRGVEQFDVRMRRAA